MTLQLKDKCVWTSCLSLRCRGKVGSEKKNWDKTFKLWRNKKKVRLIQASERREGHRQSRGSAGLFETFRTCMCIVCEKCLWIFHSNEYCAADGPTPCRKKTIIVQRHLISIASWDARESPTRVYSSPFPPYLIVFKNNYRTFHAFETIYSSVVSSTFPLSLTIN